MKHIKKLVHAETFWVVLMVVILYALAYGPIVYRYQNPIPGRTYLGFNSFAIDPLGYAATIQQGYAGRWTRLPQATSALGEKSFFVRTEYLAIGHLSRIFSIHPLLMLKIATAIISVIYILVIWKILVTVFNSKWQRLASFFLICFATGIVLPSQTSGGWLALPIDSLVFQRLTIQAPHYMLSGIFTLLSALYIYRFLVRFSIGNLILAIIFGMLANHSFFPPMMLLYLSLGFLIINRIFYVRAVKKLIQEIMGLGFFVFFSAIPLVNLWYSGQFYDMNTYRASEKLIPNAFPDFASYQLSLGGLWILTIIAIPYILKLKNVFFILSLGYILMHPFAVFIIGHRLGMSQVRFFQTPYFIFMAISATMGLNSIYELVKTKINIYVGKVITLIIIIALVSSGVFVYKKSLQYTEVSTYDTSEFGYPVIRDYQAMIWLSQYCDGTKVVLSDAIEGNLLLALTPCRVYMSDWVWKTILSEGGFLEENKNLFFSGSMGKEDALKFVRKNKITFIFFGLSEQKHHHPEASFSHLSYPFLTSVYEKDGVVIYKTE